VNSRADGRTDVGLSGIGAKFEQSSNQGNGTAVEGGAFNLNDIEC